MTDMVVYEDLLKLEVLHPNTTRRSLMTAIELGQIVKEFGSWIRFLIMLRTGKPALMTVYIAGKPSYMKVVRVGSVDPYATYETV